MAPFADWPIQRKATSLLMLIGITVVVITSISFAVYEWYSFRKNTVAETLTLAKVIADNSTASLAFDNEADATQILFALRQEKHILSAALYDREGNLFASYPGGAQRDVFPAKPQPPGYRFERNNLILFHPVVQAGKSQGILYINSSLAGLYERFRLYGLIVLLVMIFSSLVAFALSRYLQRYISEPILSLAGTARRISVEKDYSVRATVAGQDELGTLTGAFNHMLTQIHDRDIALRESEERLNLALKSSGVGTWTWNLRERKLHWDNFMYPLFGLLPGEFNGTIEEFITLVHPDDRQHLMRIAEGEDLTSPFDVEFRIIRKDNEVRYLATRGESYADANGVVQKMTGVTFDITARKEAEESLKRTAAELARSNDDLEQFAYVASHDLQEPLRAVAGCVQILERKYKGKLDQKADELITHTVDGSVRMQTLINDLLAYSRVGTKARPPEATDMNVLMRQVISDLRVKIEETGAGILFTDLPVVTADPTQMKQLLQNLVANALKFTVDRKPEVRIASELRDNEWIFSVSDNGIGIDPRYFDRIFLVFQRLHTRREFPGTGIGLAICKKIVDRHGGRMWVDSAPGKGSTFFFTLPA